jgi:hypothetical protein
LFRSAAWGSRCTPTATRRRVTATTSHRPERSRALYAGRHSFDITAANC